METLNEIDDYLMGNLSTEEKERFSAELKKNKELADLVKFHKEVNESIIDNEVVELRGKINNLLLSNNKTSKLKLIHFFYSIAAILLIAFTITSLLREPNYAKAYTCFYQPYETDINVRSDSYKAEDLDFALILYQKGEYQASFELLQNYNQSVFNNHKAQFYLGLCAIELKKYEIAEESLLEVLNSDDPSLNLHSKWYLGLIYLQTEQPEKAITFFNELKQEQNYYTKKATNILKKIN